MKTMIRNLFLIATAVIGPNLILAVTEARAALQYYEGFDYPSGELLSMQPGWSPGTTSSIYTIGNGSLGFGALQTSGNRVVATQPTGATAQAETFIPVIGADGTTTWISFLLRPETIDPSGSRLTLDPGFSFSIGKGVADTNYSIGGPNLSNPVASSTPVIVGTTVFLVVEAQFNPLTSGNDTFILFVNPTPGLSAPDVAGVTKSDLNVPSAMNTLFLIAANHAAASYDEFRIGDTFADVTPAIPEPSTLGLCACAAFFLMLRRRSWARTIRNSLPR
jgi:hypothetical protein